MARYAEVLFRHRIRFTSLFLIPVALAAGVAVGLASYRATARLSVADPPSFGATVVPGGWSANATTAFWTAQLQDSQTNLTSAQADLQKFAAANRGMPVDSTSTDSRVVLLLDRVKQWQAKVAEARDNLSLAQYTSSASARVMEIGTSVVTAPELATTSLAGDGSSAKFGALVLALGLALGLAYLVDRKSH